MTRRALGRRRVGAWLALMVLVVAIAATCLGISMARDGDRRPDTARGDAHDRGAADVPAVLDDVLGNVSDGDPKAIETNLSQFLVDVEHAAEAAHPDEMGTCAAGVQWREYGDVPQVAQDVLRSYEELSDAELVASGYVDLQGNTWCALVRRGQAWVDVVTIVTADGEVSDVHVARTVRRAEE